MTATVKATYIGAPACFALELACQHINAAFGLYGCYQVGSSIERADWRDIDVRFIMPDDVFYKLFDNALEDHWEHDPRWLLLNVSISNWLSAQTGLPVDFQIQPQKHANERHDKARLALGIAFTKQDQMCSASMTNCAEPLAMMSDQAVAEVIDDDHPEQDSDDYVDDIPF